MWLCSYKEDLYILKKMLTFEENEFMHYLQDCFLLLHEFHQFQCRTNEQVNAHYSRFEFVVLNYFVLGPFDLSFMDMEHYITILDFLLGALFFTHVFLVMSLVHVSQFINIWS